MTSKVWNYFTKNPDRPQFAICNLCKKEYSFKTSTTNLKTHLKSMHNTVFQTSLGPAEVSNNRLRVHHSHEDPLEEIGEDTGSNGEVELASDYDDLTAQIRKIYFFKVEILRCAICRAELNKDGCFYQHFKDRHEHKFREIFQKEYHVDPLEENGESAGCNDQVRLELSAQIRDLYFFKREILRCILCEVDLPKDESEYQHIKEDHENQFRVILQKQGAKRRKEEEIYKQNEDNGKEIAFKVDHSDPVPPPQTERPINNNETSSNNGRTGSEIRTEEEEINNENEIYTEVVYLDPVSPPQAKLRLTNNNKTFSNNVRRDSELRAEEESELYTDIVYINPDPPPQTKKRLTWSKETTTDNIRKRKHSTNSDEYIIKAKKTSEIESFINYTSVLLEKLPEDVCSKVQLEIIKLIMAAQGNVPSSS